MRTDCFDAVLNFNPDKEGKARRALLIIKKMNVPVSFYVIERICEENLDNFFVRVHSRTPLLLKWKDKFKVQDLRRDHIIGTGYVLNPFSEKTRGKEAKRKIGFLHELQGGEKEMLFALAQNKGMLGLKEREILYFSSLNKKSLLHLSQVLETEGKIRILSFSPLFLISQESLDFLCEKVLNFLAHFHKRHPKQTGISIERVKRRFGVQSRIFSLALKHLVRSGMIKELGSEMALSNFEAMITPEEENILQELEEMCFKGEFRSVSQKDLQMRFRLTSKSLHRMLSFLIERKKIVQGKDGFLLHSRWLDEIIEKIRESGKRELTVSDFKNMTGLTRKYAIPLLELLDQMGVTRRKGLTREIL